MKHCYVFMSRDFQTVYCNWVQRKSPLAFLDVLIEKTQSGIQTTKYRKRTHSGLYTHWTSFIPHHQKRNLVFGLLDRAYKIASTYNAIHSEFMNIKSMLIRNGYPKAYIDRCIMKYLNKKHETSVNSFTITPPMTTTINMRPPYLGEISYEIRREMQIYSIRRDCTQGS